MEHFTERQREEVRMIARAEIKGAVNEALIDFFTSKGVLTKNIIITSAIILGSLAVIAGAGKGFLGWLGFSYMAK